MKSIIEQASSIIKAIEKAWNQAEQPKEFSIKIFEKEERNFFGMTTKPAKIGIFFGDKQIIHEKPAQKPRPEIKECRSSFTTSASPEVQKTTPKSVDKSHKNIEQKQHPIHTATTQPKPLQQRQKTIPEKTQTTIAATAEKPEKPRRIPTTWNESMIAAAHDWITKTLDLMDMKSVAFNSEVAGKNLKLTFNMPLIEDAAREKQLFRSFAHLIISSLRNQYKQEIKDLKVILMRPE